jgi:DNA-binding transcriptional ArsR family regulator
VPTDELSLTFAALADPTRRSILTLLAEGEATVNEVAARFPVSLPAISRHLKVLERAGLITRSREAQWRHNRLQADPFDEAVAWMQQRTRTWRARMDRLEAYLRQDPGSAEHADPDERGTPDERTDPRGG